MKRISRREFVKSSLAAGIAATIPYRIFSQVIGSHDDIRVAIVGLGGKGRDHVDNFRVLPGVRVVAVCDADSAALAAVVKQFEDRKEKVDSYIDYRYLLEDPSIDAVVIATPNHWHSLMAIWACQAGKDVYVEKPISHDIWEGEQLAFAAMKYKRIVQCGMQNRSDIGLIEAVRYIQQQMLGPIKCARGFCYKRRESIGKVDAPQPVPATVDYDLWCGPAPKKPVMRKQFHYDWHWQWDYGNGDIGNQGVHELDLCRWFLGKQDLPYDVVAMGGRFGYIDNGETPNTMAAMFTWGETSPPLIFEVRGLPRSKDDPTTMDDYEGERIGIVIECEHGRFAGGGGGGWVYDNDGKKAKQFKGDGGREHAANFIRAVRDRNANILHANAKEGHLSACLCHMANISYRMGDRAPVERFKMELIDQWNKKEAFNAYERMITHMKANKLDINVENPVLGKMLMMHTRMEQFIGIGATTANTHIKGNYRSPFVVPALGQAGLADGSSF
jgi:predicted dehydrogenase